MRSFSSLWSALDQHLLGQHRDPVAFFQRMERTGVWHVFWPTRLIVALCGLVIAPSVLYAVSGQPFTIIATAVVAAALVFVSGLFMIIASPIAGERPGFWIAYLFLYHFSFPILSVILLCALAALTPLALWLGWLIGAPWLLGVSFADACTLAVYQNAIKRRDQRKKLRTGGPAADLPELALGQVAFWVRSALAAMLALGALAPLWLYGGDGVAGSVALLAGAAGCARVESTLLAAFGWPLVQFESKEVGWQAAYPGRTALYVDPAAARRALLVAAGSQQPSAALRALLRAGSLSFVLRRACVQLPPVQLHALLLDLSLYEGGAATIRFLQARLLAGAGRRRAEQYAALAAEAAKPPDLQRWIACLPEQPTSASLALTDDIEAALVDARGVLLLVQAQPTVTPNTVVLQRLAQSFTDQNLTARTGHSPWPVALQTHLDAHQRLLQATAHA
jgi:hypothetical protein